MFEKYKNDPIFGDPMRGYLIFHIGMAQKHGDFTKDDFE